MISRQPCGCQLMDDPDTGALYNHYRCPHHSKQQDVNGKMTVQEYKTLGVLDDKLRINEKLYMDQFSRCLGSIPTAMLGSKAIEIGGGISPYAGTLIKLGYLYELVEPSQTACNFMQATYPNIITYPWSFGSTLSKLCQGRYDVVLAAHSLEHMRDAPMALASMARLLRKNGILYIIIPDDEDLMNPGHHWFFNKTTFAATAALCGLKIDYMAERRYIEREQFLYYRLSLTWPIGEYRV